VAVYNLFIVTLAGDFRASDAHARLTAPLFTLRTAGGGLWPVSAADLLLAVSVVALFAELLKSTPSRRIAIVNHALSMLLFALCLAELMLAPACATSTFFLVTLMVLLDVLAGFMVTIPAIRRRAGVSEEF